MPFLLAMPGVAAAAMPDPVRAMIDAAIESDDEKAVDTVIALAKKTNPDDAEEIDAIADAYHDRKAEEKRLAAEEERRSLKNAGVFDNWSGKGELGVVYSTGNTDNTGVSGSITLDRKGIDWTHKLRARADYQSTNGNATREQFLVAYEPRFQINPSLFAYGLTQYDRARFQGIGTRYSVSGGLGYKLLDNDDAKLSVQAGPAFRHTEFTSGNTEDYLAALIGTDFSWTFADGLKFTQGNNVVADTGGQAQAFLGGPATTLNALFGLDASINDRLTARLSYELNYNSDPPANAVKTDTFSRFTIVYGF